MVTTTHPANKCALSVTGIRTRHECFLRRLKAFGLVLYNTLHSLFYVSDDKVLRSTIQKRIIAPTTFTTFSETIAQKCADIHAVITSTLLPYAYLMGIDCAIRTDYTEPLWIFFSRIVFEHPAVVKKDTLRGENVSYIQTSLEWFISEQIPASGE